MTSHETDPFDQVAAREAELSERQEGSAGNWKDLREMAAVLLFFAALFPVTWIFGRHIQWLVTTHLVTMAVILAAGLMIWILPASEVQDKPFDSRRTVPRDHRPPSRMMQLASSVQSFVLLAVLLPLTLLYGSHLTWLVITHVTLVGLTLSQVVMTWFRKHDLEK